MPSRAPPCAEPSSSSSPRGCCAAFRARARSSRHPACSPTSTSPRSPRTCAAVERPRRRGSSGSRRSHRRRTSPTGSGSSPGPRPGGSSESDSRPVSRWRSRRGGTPPASCRTSAATTSSSPSTSCSPRSTTWPWTPRSRPCAPRPPARGRGRRSGDDLRPLQPFRRRPARTRDQPLPRRPLRAPHLLGQHHAPGPARHLSGEGTTEMTTADVPAEGTVKKKRFNLAPLQKFGRSLMLPIASLPVAALMLRLGQPDLLGADGLGWDRIAAILAGGGNALFANLPLLFAVGVAIGMAKKADGSTAMAAVVGYLVYKGVGDAVSPFVLGEPAEGKTQELINYGVLGGILCGLIAAYLR